MMPLGPELRIYYCGTLLRSEVVRGGLNVGDVAERCESEMARAWVGGRVISEASTRIGSPGVEDFSALLASRR